MRILLILAALLLPLPAYAHDHHHEAAPAPQANAQIGGPFSLTTQEGATFTDKDLTGRLNIIVFGYTHCPNICPTQLTQLSSLLKKLPEDKVRVVFVTSDPARDTPAVIKEYLSNFDRRIIGLSGNPEAVADMLKQYRVYAKKVMQKDGKGYDMDHTSVVYLMDKQGQFVNAFNLDQPEAQAVKELQGYF